MNNLISTLGTVVTGIITAVTVIWSGRRTRDAVRKGNADLEESVRRQLQPFRDRAGMVEEPEPVTTDREVRAVDRKQRHD